MSTCDVESGVCTPAARPADAEKAPSTATAATAATAKRTVKVDIVSDTICPWCYIGKKRFEKAVSKLDASKVNVEVNWRPFFLDASLPSPGKSKLEHYKKKFGEQRTAQMLPHMAEVGRGDGINFSYGGKIGNTMNSHRLIEWSKKKGKQDEVVMALFEAYFEKEKDISDLSVLLDCAVKAALNRDEAKKFLESDELSDVVRKEVAEAYEKDVTGVPNFTFDGKYSLSGGQDPAVFLNVFRKLGAY